jgi:GNAT superfamily N-acetyltransferase
MRRAPGSRAVHALILLDRGRELALLTFLRISYILCDVKIEQLTPDETERLRRIRLRSLRDAPEAFAATFEESAARPPESWVQALRDLATFVAVVDGADVGMVRGAPPGLVAGPGSSCASLISMWVAPEQRGKGVGDALVDAVIGWARASGFARLRLEVVDENARAVALYARKGFVQTGPPVRCAPPREHLSEQERVLEL